MQALLAMHLYLNDVHAGMRFEGLLLPRHCTFKHRAKFVTAPFCADNVHACVPTDWYTSDSRMAFVYLL